MFTAYIQALDVIYLHQIGLFLIFTSISWTVHLLKINRSKNYEKQYKNILYAAGSSFNTYPKTTIIIPVVDENEFIWNTTLTKIKEAIKGLDSEVLVIANGKSSEQNAKDAIKHGFKVIRLQQASKRLAIQEGYNQSREDSEIIIILDSDTFVEATSIVYLLQPFVDKNVMGATPRQHIYYPQNIWQIVSNWLEDIRFSEILSGQKDRVSCLPGRLLAIRASFLGKHIYGLTHQTFLGSNCISGDDRYLTSRILEEGYKAVYVPTSVVHTDAPKSLTAFVKQRLRWSRTSFRETLLSLNWIFKYPYTAFSVLSTIVLRWFFFIVILTFLLKILTNNMDAHFANLSIEYMILGTLFGFIFSGMLRQLRHIKNNIRDIKYLIPFLFITTFILTPIEWFGNLTVKESGWMTRKTK